MLPWNSGSPRAYVETKDQMCRNVAEFFETRNKYVFILLQMPSQDKGERYYSKICNY